MIFAERYLPCIRNWDAVFRSVYIKMRWSMSFGNVAYLTNVKRKSKYPTRDIRLASRTVPILCVTAKSLWN